MQATSSVIANTAVSAHSPVKLHLVGGEVRTGRIARFSPTASEIFVEAGEGIARIPAELIAAIVFPPKSGHVPSSAVVRIKVTLVSALVLEVDAALDGKPARGFFARATGDASELFVYDHAVRSKERVQLLGAMLVADGAVTADGVRQGLEAQHASRKPTIGEILVLQRSADQLAIDAAVSIQARKKQRLGDVLVDAGLVSREDVDRAVAEQGKRRGRRLGAVLVELRLVDEVQLASTIAKKFCMPFVDLAAIEVNAEALREVPREVIEKHGFFPLDTDARTLTVAISDPLDATAAEVMRFHSKKRIIEVVVTPSQLKACIEQLREPAPAPDRASEIEVLLEQLAEGQSSNPAKRDEAEKERELSESNSAVIKLTNRILLDGIRRGASDIHIETNGTERSSTVRFRIDGDCVLYQEVPPTYRRSIVARLKIMADLDISERRKPQDGKIRFRLPDNTVELRIATIPTVNDNEDVVLRILSDAKPKALDQIELSERNLGALRALASKPHGLLLCVGPTGSGKTTTLHSVLGSINTVDMKIWTAEDPVEITQHGLRQVQVNPRIGLTFASAMRSFLRADPDVIMVGEMRDLETASTAIEASLTGHLVLSTLHTNSAPETVTRLLDMGLDPFSFGDALLGVLAQRLVRRLCTGCRQSRTATRADLNVLAATYGGVAELERDHGVSLESPPVLHQAVGCPACNGTGYKGRVAIHELLVVDTEIRRALTARAPADEIRRLALEGGMTTLAQDGIAKVLRGATDLRQVIGACSR